MIIDMQEHAVASLNSDFMTQQMNSYFEPFWPKFKPLEIRSKHTHTHIRSHKTQPIFVMFDI